MTSHEQNREVDYDVAIVGYGPSGVTAANFLGQYGIKTVVFERDQAIYTRARAVTVNDWTLRAYQTVGLDAELKAEMDPGGTLLWKTYAGKEIYRMHPSPDTLGHPTSSQIYQPAMEATLRRGVERFADAVTVCFGQTVTDVAQDDSGVTLTVTDADTGAVRSIRSRYALACDGGSSTIRAKLGVELVGKSYDQMWVIIDARVKKWWPGRDVLTFWSDPNRPVVDIPLALGHHRWELPLRPGEQRKDFEGEDALWKLLTPFGVTPDHVEILQHAFYVHHVLKAKDWRQGRVFLVGDAAHMMPPWAGQGMQSGIRDAQNITWKLRSVLSGELPESLLDSYEPERAPHVQEMTDVAEKLGLMIAAKQPSIVFLRNNLVPLLAKTRLMGRLLGRRGPTIERGFLTGAAGKGSAVGTMIPQPEVCTSGGIRIRLDDAFGDGFVVLGYDVDPREAVTPRDAAAWTALGARFVTVRGGRSDCHGVDELVDTTGLLGQWFGANKTRVVVIRPDRFVAASEPTGLSIPQLWGAVVDVRTPLTPASAAQPEGVSS